MRSKGPCAIDCRPSRACGCDFGRCMYTRGKVWFYLAVRRRARWAGIPFPEALADAMAWSEDVFGRIGAGSVRDHCPKLRPLDTALDVERAITAVGSAAPVQPTIEAIAEYLCPYWCEAE